MPPGDIVTAIAWIVVIGAALAVGLRSSAANKQLEALKAREAAESAEAARLAEAADLAFVETAAHLMPDWSQALSRLKQKYGWIDLLECSGLNQLHVQLLRQIFDDDNVDLPNMLLTRTDEDSRRVLRDANELTHAPGWPEDVEAMIQEPTVQTLLDLARMGYVTAQPAGLEPTREYWVSLTPSGVALKRLDSQFRDRSDRHPNWPSASPSLKLRPSVARIVGRSIAQAISSAA